ncbi:MAG: FAD-binding oxidoreductase [Gammaproteobacteria bacterium]|nr:FAD-binding oxidoreductase [Gammaproteobacteria bacterium]
MVPPDIVVYPNSTDEVAEIVSLCAEYRVPVIPFGAGTSLEGHIAAINGGVCVDLSEMNRLIQVNPTDMDVHIEAGITRKTLNRLLGSHGLFFPVDPGADATLGGMVATSASGTNAVRYGTIRDNVLGLKIVLPSGEILETGGRARKSASGYDLTRLLCGSEGTLAIITEVRLKLYGLPEANAVGVCFFDRVVEAVEVAAATIQMGIPVARIELLDDLQIKAVNRYSSLTYEEKPTLFFEFHGSRHSVVEQSERVGEIVKENGGSEFIWSDKQEEKNKLWQARHDAYYASMALRPGCRVWTTDVCVPISRLSECIEATRKDVNEQNIVAPIVGHIGDGNFHLLIVVDTQDKRELEIVSGVNERLVMRALEMGGTITGEHGIGLGKIPYMRLEHGNGVDLMRSIKKAIDPDNIMNPGKILS